MKKWIRTGLERLYFWIEGRHAKETLKELQREMRDMEEQLGRMRRTEEGLKDTIRQQEIKARKPIEENA
jgi:hypothetical protein